MMALKCGKFSFAAVAEAAVFGVSDIKYGEEVAAAVVL